MNKSRIQHVTESEQRRTRGEFISVKDSGVNKALIFHMFQLFTFRILVFTIEVINRCDVENML